MKLRWTILLLVLNIILVGVCVRLWSHPAALRAFEQQSRNFLPIESDNWEGVEIAREGDNWKVARDRWGQWWIKSPIEWPARADKMARMMGFLLGLKVDSSFSVEDLKRVGQSLRSYGLEVPRAVLTVSNSQRTQAYKIGSVTPLGGKLYVLSADKNEIWVVDGALGEYIGWGVGELRQDRFYPFEVAELEGLDIDLGDRELSFTRLPSAGGWTWKEKDAVTPLEAGVVDNWIAQLGALKVENFEKLSVDAQGLRLPYGRLSFKTLYGQRSLLVGALARAGSRWAQWEGAKTVFELPQSLLDTLAAEKLLPSRPFGFESALVTSVEANFPKNSWKLQKLENGAWVCNGHALEPAEVEKWLLTWAGLRGTPRVGNFSASDYPYSIGIQTAVGVQTLALSSDLSKGALPGVLYRLDSPVEDIAGSVFWKRQFLPVFDAASLAVSLKNMASGVEVSLDKTSPQYAALEALLVNPRVAEWTADAGAVSDFSWQLTFVSGDTSTLVFVAAGANGWVGQTSEGRFEFTPEWGALLDALCKTSP